MITYEQALEIARKHFEQRGGMTVTQATDIGDAYVFSARLDGRMACGGGAISVDKESGDVSAFLIQVDDNFSRLNHGVEMPL